MLGVAGALAAIGVLYVLTHALAPNSDVNWFLAGCAVLAAAGIVGTIGTLVWSAIAQSRQRPPRFMGVLSLGLFALVALAVAIVVSFSPGDRPADAQIWAGYQTTRNGITKVTASWVQPRVWPLGPRRNHVSFWAGLTYPESRAVEQIGTEVSCARHAQTAYHAWYELYPADVVMIDVVIKPGDHVTAAVVRLDQDRFRLTLTNETTGARFATVQVARGVGNMHGAIVTEESNRRAVDLAGFDPVHFTGCAFNSRPIDHFPLTSFDVWSDAGVIETATSQVAADGSGFTVTRR